VATAVAARVVLDEAILVSAVSKLVSLDADLARVVALYGPPPLWVREPGFPSLLYIILEQQVSLASARALYQRVLGAVRPLTPGRFLKLTDVQLRELGFSRQKALYARLLAKAIRGRQLALHKLHELEDHHARAQLMALKGIGVWTADIYLMSALRRPDIWPVGDSGAGHGGAGSEGTAAETVTEKAGEPVPVVASLALGGGPHLLARISQ